VTPAQTYQWAGRAAHEEHLVLLPLAAVAGRRRARVGVRYLGFYDGNPANLNPLPPVEAGKHYVEAMGGADRVLAAAHAAFDRGSTAGQRSW
jgi:Alkyl sulfatase dimerisation